MNESTALICRESDDGRFIAGIAVPWDEEIVYGGQPESFVRGGLTPGDGEVVPLRWAHNRDVVPIGVLSDWRDDERGLWTEWRMYPGDDAGRAWQAAADGVARGLSVEFTRPGGLPVGGQGAVTDGVLVGASLTEHPAYPGAVITSVRDDGPDVTAGTLAEWREWRQGITDRADWWRRWHRLTALRDRCGMMGG